MLPNEEGSGPNLGSVCTHVCVLPKLSIMSVIIRIHGSKKIDTGDFILYYLTEKFPFEHFGTDL